MTTAQRNGNGSAPGRPAGPAGPGTGGRRPSGPMGGPFGGMGMPVEKAKDFKGSARRLIAYLRLPKAQWPS